MVIRPVTRPRTHGMAAAGQRAVVRQRLGEPHRDAGADRGGQADEERRPGVLGGEGGGEHRRQRRHRAVHQADQAGLDDAQDEIAPGGLVLLRRRRPWSRRPPATPPWSRGPPRCRRGRRAACARRCRSPGPPPGGRSWRPRPPSRRRGPRIASMLNCGVSHTGLRRMKPRTSSRRISGMWSPKRLW